MLLKDLLRVLNRLLAVEDVLVHFLVEVIVVLVVLLLVRELDPGFRLAPDHQFLLVALFVNLALVFADLLEARRQAQELGNLLLALLENLFDCLVAHLDRLGYLPIQLDDLELLRQMADARLDVDEHPRQPLVLPTVSLALLRGLTQVGLEIIDGLASGTATAIGELELLYLRAQVPPLFLELLNGGVVVLRQLGEVLLSVILRQELLDDLVGVIHASRLLDLVESMDEELDLLLLFGHIPSGASLVSSRQITHLSLLAALVLLLLLLLLHPLTHLQALVHLHPLFHQSLLLLDLLVALIPLLHHPLLKAVQLCLRHLLGMVGVMGEK
mmetsp:Transcript_23507/g.54558  ORF Transcript_23507/g.54558 Transcript_23507/m.54558 type:complete len:328 (+) Transcript_23507:179-1162(+)